MLSNLYINSASVDNDCGHSGQKILLEDGFFNKSLFLGLLTSGVNSDFEISALFTSAPANKPRSTFFPS